MGGWYNSMTEHWLITSQTRSTTQYPTLHISCVINKRNEKFYVSLYVCFVCLQIYVYACVYMHVDARGELPLTHLRCLPP